jgi:pimeloyl-ACP methyl ester carboxylesterase
LYSSGPKGAPPVVLLHGSCGNSAFWLGDLFPLAERFPGSHRWTSSARRAQRRKPLDFESDAYVRWLEAVLDALDIPVRR